MEYKNLASEYFKNFEANHLMDKSKEIKSNVFKKIYDDDSHYLGEFEGERREGKGVITFGNGEQYAGDWKKDLIWGFGCFQF